MAGGPSHLDLFDWKPELVKRDGQNIPESFIKGKRFAFMNSSFKNPQKLQGTIRKFKQHGQSGMWASECFPHIGSIADEITLVRTCKTDLFNHAPAKLFMNTGSGIFGRPSMGSWVTYGIGSESSNLPGFVVLQSGPRGPRGGAVNWASGFLPTTHQGVPLRGSGDPILNLANPTGVSARSQRDSLDTLRELNLKRLIETGDEEIRTRIASYEMSYQMQSNAPELMDLSQESESTLDLYGAKRDQSSFARNCLLARRLVERGTRFVQLYHTNWDHHGGPTETLTKHLTQVTKEVDQPAAALVRDLKARGLLDDTLVIWGGEFGRTVYRQGGDAKSYGRDHHPRCFTSWVAGGGIRGGVSHGQTDEYSYNIVDRDGKKTTRFEDDAVHVRDLNATILHQLGIDHQRLTFPFQGLDQKLTGVVEAHVVKKILA